MTDFYNANIKIDDICREIHLSPYYFMRIFKEQIGQSPHRFLLSVRMSKAEKKSLIRVLGVTDHQTASVIDMVFHYG